MTINSATRIQVRRRADGRCEYCLQVEYAIGFSYHVDHIIARKHSGTDHLDNLAWSCFDCNIFKGADISSYDSDTGELTPLYNPRTQNWDDHFVKDNLLIHGKTAIGRVTVKILQMNHPDKLDMRHTHKLLGLW